MNTHAHLDQLPAGSVIEIPGGMTTAVLVPNAFRNGRPGWSINGSATPVSTSQLGAFGRGWRVREQAS